MKNVLRLKNLSLIVLVFVFLACTKEIQYLKDQDTKDGKYDSEFPVKPTSEGLDEIMTTVKLLSTIAFYESYDLDPSFGLTITDLDYETVQARAISKYHFNQPATGTATVVYRSERLVALLTCAHIVQFPDTIVAYYRDENGQETNIVTTIAYKIRQNINIIDFLLGSDFEILAMDLKSDIALIGKKLKIDTPFTIPVFNFPQGNATDLDWGTFIYVIGFPRGEKMVTRGIVSQPPRVKDDSYIIDAVFNRGFSGGIVLAMRDGAPNFELVGMAKSVPAETKLYLAPDKSFKILETSPQLNYEGDVRVNTHENIFYGITYVVTAEAIANFISDNSDALRQAGYRPDLFFPVKN